MNMGLSSGRHYNPAKLKIWFVRFTNESVKSPWVERSSRSARNGGWGVAKGPVRALARNSSANSCSVFAATGAGQDEADCGWSCSIFSLAFGHKQ